MRATIGSGTGSSPCMTGWTERGRRARAISRQARRPMTWTRRILMPPDVEPVMPPDHMNEKRMTWAAGTQSTKSPRPPAPVALPNPHEVASVTTLNRALRNPAPAPTPSPTSSSVTPTVAPTMPAR